MKLMKNVHGIWTARDEAIKIHYNNLICEEKQKLEFMKRDIIWELLSNKKFVKDFLAICKNEIYPEYEIPVSINEDIDLVLIIINIENALEFYEHNHDMKTWQKKAYEELKTYHTYEHVKGLLNKKEIKPGLTYRGLFDFMLKPRSFIEECINNNNFLGYDGETFYRIIYDSVFKSSFLKKALFDNLNMSEDELDRFNENFELIKYHFEPNVAAGQWFYTSKNVVDEFTLNEELKNSIMNEIPSHFNKLQKAYYVYRRLCQKFSYDEEYFYYEYRLEDAVMPKAPTANHRDINRLNNLKDGDDVICTEITMIYCKFLELLDILYRVTDYHDKTDINYDALHMKVRFKIGDYIVDADAAHGLYGSDMSCEKSFDEVNNFTVNSVIPKRYRDKAKNELKEVDRYFKNNKDKNEFEDALEIYRKDFKTRDFVPIEERVDILCDMVSKIELKFMDTLSWINTLKRQLFEGYEGYYKIEFIINTKPVQKDKNYELAIVIMYNKLENVDDDLTTNNYIVITADKKFEKIKYEELVRRFRNGTYDFTTTEREKRHKGWYGYEDEDTYGNTK